ncbi:MAG: PhoH family protein [Phycisphaerales bacterium]|nr:PhoH family protein [Phycisphaerales bacterium]
MGKNYVLDANILLHDPASIFSFADNTVVIPIGVIEEIDRFKKEMTDRGYNARAVARRLDALRGEQSLVRGIALPNGGMLRVYCDPNKSAIGGRANGDTEILRAADDLQKAEPNTPVTIVTKDINLRIRADVLGLHTEDYESDHVRLSDLETGAWELVLEPEVMEDFRRHGEIDLPNGQRAPNEYALMQTRGNEKNTMLGRVDPEGRKLIALQTPENGLCGIRPRNKEQYYALDALLDERIQLVTLMGRAGTGKTLLAMAAAVYTTLERKLYRGTLVARPIVPLGRDLGFLPGQIENKLEPWMKPIVDTIDFLMDSRGAIRGYRDSAALLGSGLVEIQPLTYIRGRSISKRFVVIDEAQNLTPLEVKTVITRIGQGSKVVLTGDPDQIDNPYVDSNSNGFSYLMKRFRSQPPAAHVSLRKGERSSLAELAANLL